jgi:[ribosomal protein S5]-alanine N-acetyltransferase
MSFHPTTQRLILRAPMLSDVNAVVMLLNDYDVAKNLRRVPHPFTEAMYRDRLAEIETERQNGSTFGFAVTRAMDGAFIGFCSLDREDDGTWEFGYWYGKPYWGQGYATEAARPVLRFAFEDVGVEAPAAGWYFDNPASGHVLEKLGFKATGIVRVNCVSRGGEVVSNRVQLTRDKFARKKAA